jgi:hypothetical protein
MVAVAVVMRTLWWFHCNDEAVAVVAMVIVREVVVMMKYF